MYKARFCPYCKKQKDDQNELGRRYPSYWEIGWLSDEDVFCSKCNTLLVKMNLTNDEFDDIIDISNDPSFIQAMDELKSKDIVEFNLKMSQFRTQINQQKQTEESNTPKCPHCNSTNIKSISGLNRAGSIAMFGIFSKKINKSFECKNCGYTWQKSIMFF